jgi:putative SOS response-associated peptidase YedK
MCGRFTIAKPERIIIEFQPDEVGSNLDAPRYNVAPMQQIPTVIGAQDGRRTIKDIRWGFAPHWAEDAATGSRIINARAETASSKPAFRDAFRQTRCLIPADGFYEWQKTPDGKQPMYMQVEDGEMFAIAGLYSIRQQGDSEPLLSCTIMTTSPNSLLEPIHHRMPVILPKDCWTPWLDTSNDDKAQLQDMLQPFPAEKMTARKVSRLVNSPANDDPRCIEPLD